VHFHSNIRSITQKRMIPKCSNLVLGMTLGYPTSNIVLGLKLERSKVKVSVRVRVRVEQFGVGLNSTSALYSILSLIVGYRMHVHVRMYVCMYVYMCKYVRGILRTGAMIISTPSSQSCCRISGTLSFHSSASRRLWNDKMATPLL